MRTRLALVLFVVIIVTALNWREPAAADQGDVSGFIPSAGGYGLIVWGGGSIDDLATSLKTRGCSLAAAWASPSGTFVAFIIGAPAFVNEPFLSQFPNGQMAPNSALLVSCSLNGTVPPPTSATPAPVAPPSASLRYGDTGRGGIRLSNDYDDWKFSGQTGDVVTIRLTQDGGASFSPAFRLLDPTQVDTNGCITPGYIGGTYTPNEARLLNYQLKFSGTYTIRIAESCTPSTGGYSVGISLKALPRALVYGQSGTGTIPLSNDYDVWTFSGQAGDAVTIRLLQDRGASFTPAFRLLDPSRADVIGCITPGYIGGTYTPNEARLQNYQLKFSGTYTIRIAESCTSSTGGYSVSLNVPIIVATPTATATVPPTATPAAPATPTPPATPIPVLACGQDALTITFFSDVNLGSQVSSDCQPHPGGVGGFVPGGSYGPGPGGRNHLQSNYSIRFEQWANYAAGKYHCDVESDDGARLWLDDRLLIDDWSAHGPDRKDADFTISSPGVHHLRLDYWQGGGGATISANCVKTS